MISRAIHESNFMMDGAVAKKSSCKVNKLQMNGFRISSDAVCSLVEP